MMPSPVTLGFSPCPNDTFMFAALANGWIDTRGYQFDIRMDDVETLNEWAGEGKLAVSKLSFSRYFSVEDQYHLLDSGAALGHGCGPLVIARKSLSREELANGTVALPGKWTTAHLLFRLMYPEAESKQFMPFHHVEDAVLTGEATVGVIIHENRFTYADKGLIKITDLGEAWETLSGHPIPLGGIFARTDIPVQICRELSNLIRDSITYAYAHPDLVMPWVRQYAQELSEDVIRQHIGLYVNEFSLSLGEKGHEAIRQLKKMLP